MENAIIAYRECASSPSWLDLDLPEIQRELDRLEVAPGILEMAEEIASGADGTGIERWRLEYLLRCVLFVDRRAR
jgi:hypothetical protein